MKHKKLIKIGFCIAYDWELLRYSLPLVYDKADSVCLSLDKNRTSWSGEQFHFDNEAFKFFIKSIDKRKKIFIEEENFHLQKLTPMENEVRQRNHMAECLGTGGWHIQFDCDEYFVGFPNFVEYLHRLPHYNYNFNVCCPLITLFKKTKNGFLIIDPLYKSNIEHIQIATLNPSYEYGRRNGNLNKYSNFSMVHQSWARSEDEIIQKLNSWGHINDFDINNYFHFWKSLNEHNYSSIKKFHPIQPTKWPSLRLINVSTIEECVETLGNSNFVRLSRVDLLIKNSQLFSKLRQMLRI